MIAYIKFGENMSSISQDIKRKQNFSINIKFGENMSSISQDIKRKQNFSINKGP